jgi:hypothetical protein
MRVTLDDQAIFDEQGLQINVGNPSRACIERSVCGLDGVVSIDLGKRTREIRQRGMLQAPSRTAMTARTASIAAFIDGGMHILRTAQGQEYDNVRMDAFTLGEERVGGPGVSVDYEILYVQLGA